MNKYKKIKRECKKLENRKNQRKMLNENQVKFFLFIIKNDIKQICISTNISNHRQVKAECR